MNVGVLRLLMVINIFFIGYWKAFDNSTGSGWWTLGLNNVAGSNQDKNWIQMELTGGAQTIHESVKLFNHKRHLLMEITFTINGKQYW